MQPDPAIVATLTSADGRKKQYITATDIDLITEGLAMVYQRTERLHNRWSAPFYCKEISALQIKFMALERKPIYV